MCVADECVWHSESSLSINSTCILNTGPSRLPFCALYAIAYACAARPRVGHISPNRCAGVAFAPGAASGRRAARGFICSRASSADKGLGAMPPWRCERRETHSSGSRTVCSTRALGKAARMNGKNCVYGWLRRPRVERGTFSQAARAGNVKVPRSIRGRRTLDVVARLVLSAAVNRVTLEQVAHGRGIGAIKDEALARAVRVVRPPAARCKLSVS